MPRDWPQGEWYLFEGQAYIIGPPRWSWLPHKTERPCPVVEHGFWRTCGDCYLTVLGSVIPFCSRHKAGCIFRGNNNENDCWLMIPDCPQWHGRNFGTQII